MKENTNPKELICSLLSEIQKLTDCNEKCNHYKKLTMKDRFLEILSKATECKELIDRKVECNWKEKTRIRLFQDDITENLTFKESLQYNAGIVDKDGNIGYEQFGARDSFSVGLPMYSDDWKLIGYLGISLYENLDIHYSNSEINEKLKNDNIEAKSYYWFIVGYKGNAQHVNTYWQYLNHLEQNNEKNKQKFGELKVGDSIYVVSLNDVRRDKITNIEISKVGTCHITTDNLVHGDCGDYHDYYVNIDCNSEKIRTLCTIIFSNVTALKEWFDGYKKYIKL